MFERYTVCFFYLSGEKNIIKILARKCSQFDVKFTQALLAPETFDLLASNATYSK